MSQMDGFVIELVQNSSRKVFVKSVSNKQTYNVFYCTRLTDLWATLSVV
jgi:hypothetical protein